MIKTEEHDHKYTEYISFFPPHKHKEGLVYHANYPEHQHISPASRSTDIKLF